MGVLFYIYSSETIYSDGSRKLYGFPLFLYRHIFFGICRTRLMRTGDTSDEQGQKYDNFKFHL